MNARQRRKRPPSRLAPPEGMVTLRDDSYMNADYIQFSAETRMEHMYFLSASERRAQWGDDYDAAAHVSRFKR